jgi:hypothetical protein
MAGLLGFGPHSLRYAASCAMPKFYFVLRHCVKYVLDNIIKLGESSSSTGAWVKGLEGWF